MVVGCHVTGSRYAGRVLHRIAAKVTSELDLKLAIVMRPEAGHIMALLVVGWQVRSRNMSELFV